jgi:hypothetical protein
MVSFPINIQARHSIFYEVTAYVTSLRLDVFLDCDVDEAVITNFSSNLQHRRNAALAAGGRARVQLPSLASWLRQHIQLLRAGIGYSAFQDLTNMFLVLVVLPYVRQTFVKMS